MPLFQDFADRFVGTVALSLQKRTAEDIDRLLRGILDTAVALWEETNWMTFDSQETNCTVQLYRWCKEACRHDPRFALVVPQLEWIDVTAAVMSGAESVKSARRPDLRFDVGATGRSVECKRLGPVGGRPRAYVYDGLARFVVGRYGHGEPVGYMVGYVQAGEIPDLVVRINDQVAGHPKMGPDQELSPLQDYESSSWSRSSHPRASDMSIRIDHLLVNLLSH